MAKWIKGSLKFTSAHLLTLIRSNLSQVNLLDTLDKVEFNINDFILDKWKGNASYKFNCLCISNTMKQTMEVVMEIYLMKIV